MASHHLRAALPALALLSLTGSVHATTCANALPAGAYVTPACTWIVAQYDPGVWRDNRAHYWILPPCRADGVCSSLPVDIGTDPPVGR